MAFGMDNLMESIYGDPAKRGSYVDPKQTANIESNKSMSGLMQVVGEMYSGNNQQSDSNNTSDGSRRTRDGNNQQSDNTAQTSAVSADQLKSEFCAWVKKLDQAVSSADSTNKQAGDQLWQSVVQHVDDCWKNFTENGQVPQ